MARLKTKLQSFYRTHQSSLYTFVMLAAERVDLAIEDEYVARYNLSQTCGRWLAAPRFN